MNHLSEFIIQLYCILQEYHPIVSWSDNRKSFIINDFKRFTDSVLSNYLNIDFETFKIQLKQHGYQLIPNKQKVWEFQHPIYHQSLLKSSLFRSIITTKTTINHLHLYQLDLKNKIHKKYQKQRQIQKLLSCIKKDMQDQNNEIDRWTMKQAASTLPAAIKAIEKIKGQGDDDDLSGVVLPTYRYNTYSEWSVPPRVLLVDDDSIFRAISTQLLKCAGCHIEVAVDGLDALNKLTKGGYDLILMDIMMPNLDGVSTTRSIRQYDLYTPIISMTSNISDLDMQTYRMNGMTDILEKPLRQSTLCKLLERYCAHLIQKKSITIPK